MVYFFPGDAVSAALTICSQVDDVGSKLGQMPIVTQLKFQLGKFCWIASFFPAQLCEITSSSTTQEQRITIAGVNSTWLPQLPHLLLAPPPYQYSAAALAPQPQGRELRDHMYSYTGLRGKRSYRPCTVGDRSHSYWRVDKQYTSDFSMPF